MWEQGGCVEEGWKRGKEGRHRERALGCIGFREERNSGPETGF